MWMCVCSYGSFSFIHKPNEAHQMYVYIHINMYYGTKYIAKPTVGSTLDVLHILINCSRFTFRNLLEFP